MGIDVRQGAMRLDGWDELVANLRKLPRKPAERALVRGLAAGAALVKKETRKEAPVRRRGGVKRMGRRSTTVRAPGFLSRNIKYRKQKGRIAYHVGPSRAAFYGQIVHEGQGRVGKADRFLDRAWNRARPNLLRVMARRVEQQIVKEVKKLNG